jgi:hypothetical protein
MRNHPAIANHFGIAREDAGTVARELSLASVWMIIKPLEGDVDAHS